MATLYRNFPDRRSLLEALYIDQVKEMVFSTADLIELPPWDALTTWLRRSVTWTTSSTLLSTVYTPAPIDPGNGGRQTF